eukprot:TRINITY_DN3689_c2_g4_i1.p1 TRINITY_DN3689_c2_g4~~TRINITY_DN3689_c2_g4_i1.p1  ORF type:complete len:1310 (+),score=286.64 TRINITY_DN3689_c2_g4_i1:228-3932(+)
MAKEDPKPPPPAVVVTHCCEAAQAVPAVRPRPFHVRVRSCSRPPELLEGAAARPSTPNRSPSPSQRSQGSFTVKEGRMISKLLRKVEQLEADLAKEKKVTKEYRTLTLPRMPAVRSRHASLALPLDASPRPSPRGRTPSPLAFSQPAEPQSNGSSYADRLISLFVPPAKHIAPLDNTATPLDNAAAPLLVEFPKPLPVPESFGPSKRSLHQGFPAPRSITPPVHIATEGIASAFSPPPALRVPLTPRGPPPPLSARLPPLPMPETEESSEPMSLAAIAAARRRKPRVPPLALSRLFADPPPQPDNSRPVTTRVRVASPPHRLGGSGHPGEQPHRLADDGSVTALHIARRHSSMALWDLAEAQKKRDNYEFGGYVRVSCVKKSESMAILPAVVPPTPRSRGDKPSQPRTPILGDRVSLLRKALISCAREWLHVLLPVGEAKEVLATASFFNLARSRQYDLCEAACQCYALLCLHALGGSSRGVTLRSANAEVELLQLALSRKQRLRTRLQLLDLVCVTVALSQPGRNLYMRATERSRLAEPVTFTKAVCIYTFVARSPPSTSLALINCIVAGTTTAKRVAVRSYLMLVFLPALLQALQEDSGETDALLAGIGSDIAQLSVWTESQRKAALAEIRAILQQVVSEVEETKGRHTQELAALLHQLLPFIPETLPKLAVQQQGLRPDTAAQLPCGADASPPPPPPPPPPPLPPPFGAPPPPPPPPGMGMKASRQRSVYNGPVPRVKMRQFFWVKLIDKPTVSKTIWVNSKLAEAKVPVPVEELEHLFQQKSIERASGGDTSTAAGTVAAVPALLEQKRSYNMSIALSHARMRPWSQCWADLAQEVAVASSSLPFEVLQVLEVNAPTSEEVTTLLAYTGEKLVLPKAEQFLLAMCEVAMYSEKVEALMFRAQFVGMWGDLMQKLAVLEQAVKEVRECKNLELVFLTILNVGNFLNCGTSQGNAAGFKLESLKKVSDLRSTVKGKLTLLHYIVQLVDKSCEHSVLLFPSELKSVSAVAAISLQDMFDGVTRLKASCTRQVHFVSKTDLEFANQMQVFCERSQEQVGELVRRSAHAFDDAQQLAYFFGQEDVTQPTHLSDFFVILRDFQILWEACYTQLMLEKEQEAKRKARELRVAADTGRRWNSMRVKPASERHSLEEVVGRLQAQQEAIPANPLATDTTAGVPKEEPLPPQTPSPPSDSGTPTPPSDAGTPTPESTPGPVRRVCDGVLAARVASEPFLL